MFFLSRSAFNHSFLQIDTTDYVAVGRRSLSLVFHPCLFKHVRKMKIFLRNFESINIIYKNKNFRFLENKTLFNIK